MCLSIMAKGDFDTGLGTVSGDSDVWRIQLGFPTGKGISYGGINISNEIKGLNEAWNNHYEPELRKWFKVIDADFVKKNSKYKGLIGRCWHPMLDNWAGEAIETGGRGKSKHKKTAVSVGADFDYKPIRLSDEDIKNLWNEPLSREARASLWDRAVKLLGSGMKETQARTFIGKLIKTYGEQEVAGAIGQIMVRAVMPADPKSFIVDLLNKNNRGSIAENKARSQRSKVAL